MLLKQLLLEQVLLEQDTWTRAAALSLGHTHRMLQS